MRTVLGQSTVECVVQKFFCAGDSLKILKLPNCESFPFGKDDM